MRRIALALVNLAHLVLVCSGESCHVDGDILRHDTDSRSYYVCRLFGNHFLKLEESCPPHYVFSPVEFACLPEEFYEVIASSEHIMEDSLQHLDNAVEVQVDSPMIMGRMQEILEPRSLLSVQSEDTATAETTTTPPTVAKTDAAVSLCSNVEGFKDPSSCKHYQVCRYNYFTQQVAIRSLPCGEREIWCSAYRKCYPEVLCPTDCDGNPKMILAPGPLGCTAIGYFPVTSDCRKYLRCGLTRNQEWMETVGTCPPESPYFCHELRVCARACFGSCGTEPRDNVIS